MSKSFRPISAKRFKKIEAFFRSCFQTFESLKNEVVRLAEIVSSKSIIIAPDKKGDDPLTVRISSADVNGYSLQLKQAKLDKKEAQQTLKKAETAYKDACKHNAACIMDKHSKLNSKLAGEHKARREKGTCEVKVVNIVTNLQTTDDPKFTSLRDALQDGHYSFRKEMDAIINKADEETYTTISGLYSIKTSIYKSVKVEFFSGSVVDNDATDKGTDNDDDTAAVSAG
jgi:hypothetical protein